MLTLECFVCEKRLNMKHCSKCKSVPYCSQECQISDWKVHKTWCGNAIEMYCMAIWGAMDAAGLISACLATSIIISDLLDKDGIENNIVIGYIVLGLPNLTTKDPRPTLRHVWVESMHPSGQKKIIETSRQVRKRSSIIVSYETEFPTGCFRFDRETAEEIKESDELEGLIQSYLKHKDKKKAMKVIIKANPIWLGIYHTAFHMKEMVNL